ncbi:MAG: hypothetical protein V1807_00100 [Patescibacteria group bacterium]
MAKVATPKTTSRHAPKTSIGLSLLIAALLVIVGTISFLYADGLTTLYQYWAALATPHVQLEITPQATNIAADSPDPIFIDIQLKNTEGQLLDGSNIKLTTVSGQATIDPATMSPADVSQRFWLQAPDQPQTIILAFSYKYLIKNLIIEVFDPAPPAKATITAPLTDTLLTTATPIVSGDAPDNTQIEIYADDLLNTTTEVKDNHFSVNTIALRSGKHKIFAVVVNQYGIRSPASASVTIDIRTPNPEIDLTNLRINPNPVKVSESFQIFVPISSHTQAVQLMIDGRPYPLFDTNNSGVFSGVIPSPHYPGIYRLSLVVTTAGGENILTEKVASLQVN